MLCDGQFVFPPQFKRSRSTWTDHERTSEGMLKDTVQLAEICIMLHNR